jgi:hypothetical protein
MRIGEIVRHLHRGCQDLAEEQFPVGGAVALWETLVDKGFLYIIWIGNLVFELQELQVIHAAVHDVERCTQQRRAPKHRGLALPCRNPVIILAFAPVLVTENIRISNETDQRQFRMAGLADHGSQPGPDRLRRVKKRLVVFVFHRIATPPLDQPSQPKQ